MSAALICALIASAAQAEPYDGKVVQAPQIGYLDEAGQPKLFNPHAHKLTAVHFWAIWCAPCVEELPQIDKVLQTYSKKGFAVLALSQDGMGNAAKVRAFLREHHIARLPAYIDDNSNVFRAMHGRGLPTTFFVDSDGDIVGGSEGPMEWNTPEFKAFLDDALSDETSEPKKTAL